MSPDVAQGRPYSDCAQVAFTEQDITLFSEASGDRNPLHLSLPYAQRTPYGQPVAFGCLGALACIGLIKIPADTCVDSLSADFLRPLFSGVQYQLKMKRGASFLEAGLFDGSSTVMLVKATASASSGANSWKGDESLGVFRCAVSSPLQPHEIARGVSASGSYACNGRALTRLTERWGVKDPLVALGLCWTSYLVGMELPGESALFFKLALRFQRETASNFPMQYQARIAYAGFDQIKIVADLGCGGKSLASGQCWSYVRPPVPPIENADPTGVVPGSLAGKIAVITGVSRGLGAAIARALEVRGAIVYGISRSECELDASQVERGDAADPEISTQLRERILRKHGRLDYLICNASPPLLPLTLERNGANRIAAFIQSTIALTLFPLCELSDLLQRSDACLVIISSVAAESPVKEWPHYVAAKRAIEALGSVAVLQHPSLRTLIVRPEKLMTNLTNTPMGHVNAGSPKELARRLAERLEDPPAPGVVEILY